MNSFNHIIIVGYLGRDPELRTTPAGNSVCNFSVATTDRDITTWFKVNCFNKLAENVNKYVSKGSKVYIEGSLHSRSYTDNSGNERFSLEVNANSVRFLDSKSDRESDARAATAGSTTNTTGSSLPATNDAFDDGIPF